MFNYQFQYKDDNDLDFLVKIDADSSGEDISIDDYEISLIVGQDENETIIKMPDEWQKSMWSKSSVSDDAYDFVWEYQEGERIDCESGISHTFR